MSLTKIQKEKLITSSKNDILLFVNKLILEPYNEAVKTNYFITNQQREGLLAVEKLVQDKRRGKSQDILGVSIMSGKGTGKDAMTTWVILWFMLCFPFPKVPCISVSADQLNKVLWSELSKWLKHSAISDFFVLQSDKFFLKDIGEKVRGKEWFAFTKAANPKTSPDEQVETLAGQHSDYLLQVVDEGSGILNPVYETLEKNQTSYCNLMLIIFNPMHSKGYAVDTHGKYKHRWVTLRWNAEESEIVNRQNIKRIADDFGKDSNTYRMNVLGLPPLFDEETLINWEWVMAAIDKPLELLPETPLVQAVDCGAGGDKSIIASRRGNMIYPFKRKSTRDSNELVNWIGANMDIEMPDTIRVDTIGIGWAVEGALRDKKGSMVEAADVRRRADNDDRFINKRAEMYWNLRDLFEKGSLSIPDDPELKEQLGAIKYEITAQGKIQIIEKKKIKAEIGHSPDELDAMAILYYYPDSMVSKQVKKGFRRIKSKGTWMAA